MDSGPGAYAPSRNDGPLDVSGFIIDGLDAEILHRVDIGDGSHTPGYQHPYSNPIGQR
jgi:hypothetical protein